MARISVPISDADRTEVGRLQRKLQGMSEGGIARILLHYGVRHAAEAFAEAIHEQDEPEEQRDDEE